LFDKENQKLKVVSGKMQDARETGNRAMDTDCAGSGGVGSAGVFSGAIFLLVDSKNFFDFKIIKERSLI